MSHNPYCYPDFSFFDRYKLYLSSMATNWVLPLHQVPSHSTEDKSIIWNRIRLAYEQKLFGQVTSVAYNNRGTQVACTSTNQFVLLRVPQTEGVVVNEQCDRSLFSVRFREDDKLFIQCVDKRISIKSSETAFERQFLGHTRDVRCAAFVGTHNFASGSDDTTVKLWDLLSETELMTASVHTDYVRSIEPYLNGSFFTGSYDRSVHLWDPRTSFSNSLQSSGNLLTQSVESLCFSNDLSLLACASGDQLLLFDPRKGLTAPLYQSSCHTKAITTLAYSKEYKTLITGSLDSRVKMFSFDEGNCHCLSTKRLSNPVAAVAVHPRSEEFIVGMTSGDVRILKVNASVEATDTTETVSSTNHEVLTSKLKVVQQQLKVFNYGQALRSALYSRQPDVVMSSLEELLRRGALHIALSNQNDRTIAQILRFTVSHLDTPQFCSTLFYVLEDIFEIYGSSLGNNLFLHREFLIARKKLGATLETISKMEQVQSVMEFIIEGGVQ